MASGSRPNSTAATVAGALGFGVAGAIALGLGTAASAAEPAQPTKQELLEQLKALNSKVEKLEARRQERAHQDAQQQAPVQPAESQPIASPPVATQPQLAEKGATVDSVLRDAERRSSPAMLQPEGFTAGYDKGKFIIQDASGNFVLNPNFQLQVRYVANLRDSDETFATPDEPDTEGGEDNFSEGFEVRRMRFAFDGNAFSPALTYRFQWETNRNNGQVLLQDAYVRYALGDLWGDRTRNWAVRAGQFKDPTFHEEIMSSKRQLAADRSLLNELLGGGITDWVQGVALIWDDGPGGSPVRSEIGFTDGPGTRNTNFTNTGGGLPASYPGSGSPEWGAFARVEVLARGDWKQYEDFTALGNTDGLLVFGAGASYAEVGDGDVFFHTADVQYESGRLGLYAAYVGLYSEPQGTIPGGEGEEDDDEDDVTVAGAGAYEYGVLVQAAYLLNDKWEVFGRYDHTFLDTDRLLPNAGDSYPEFTFGVNHYIRGHAAKLTLDTVYAPNGVPTDQAGIGLLDPDGDEQQIAVRAQFQLLL